MSWIPGWDTVANAGWWSTFYFWASIGSLMLLGASEVVSHRYSERKDELSEQEQTKTQQKHDEEIARLHLETANANASTEMLRKENLEMLHAISPRSIDQSGYVTEPLKVFAGMRVFLGSVPDPEAQRTAGQLALLFQMSDWNISPLPGDGNIEPFNEGISVSYSLDAITSEPMPPGALRAKQAAETIVEQLKIQKIEASVRGLPARYGFWPETVPRDALIVRVSTKPTTYFLERKYPELREAREQHEKMMEEMKERLSNTLKDGQSVPPPAQK